MKIDLNLYVAVSLSLAFDHPALQIEIIIDYFDEYDMLALLGIIYRIEHPLSAYIHLTEFGRKCQLHKDNWSAWILVPLD